MDVAKLDPAVARSIFSWLAAQEGRRVRIEVGTYDFDPSLSRTDPVLSLITRIGALAPADPDRLRDGDAALLLELPELAVGTLRIEPDEIAQITLDGGTGSLHIYYGNSTFIAILPPLPSTAHPEGAARIDALPQSL